VDPKDVHVNPDLVPLVLLEEVQAGNWNFGSVAIAARKRASGVWEEKRVGKSPLIAERDHTREQKKEEEGKKGKDEKGRGPRRLRPICPWLTTTSTTGTSTCGGGSGIRVLHADDAN
jgi:hypothetical protein